METPKPTPSEKETALLKKVQEMKLFTTMTIAKIGPFSEIEIQRIPGGHIYWHRTEASDGSPLGATGVFVPRSKQIV